MPEPSVDDLFDLAMQHHRAGRIGDAERVYQKILALHPDDPDALHLLGVLEFQTHRPAPAIERIRKAIAIDPDMAEYHFNLGLALQGLGQRDDAMNAVRRAIQLRPDFAEAFNALGVMLAQNNDMKEAVEFLRRAVQTRPDFPEALSNLGNALCALRQLDEAIACLRRSVELCPNIAEPANNLGIALQEKGDYDESVEQLRRAIALKPAYPEAWNNLAKTLQLKDDLERSAEAARQAIALRPQYAVAYGTLANALKDLGQIEEAVDCYEKALSLRPDLINTRSSLLLALHYHPGKDPQTIYQAHLEWAKVHARPSGRPDGKFANRPNPRRPLRVGYVSPDFCSHSVAYFFENLLAHHDRVRFQIFCYADMIHSDAVTDRLRRLADVWRDITDIPDADVAGMIRGDQIDILVDLAGHTRNNRLLLFARKPAPVLVSYLGYPDTTGLEAIDYRLTDAQADPPGKTERFHTEQLIRLPDAFLCYRPSESPEVKPPPSLSTGCVTFGSFNVLSKITAPMLAAWSRIFQQVPRSRLILKSYLGLAGEQTRKRLLDAFARANVDPRRVELMGKIPSHLAHLEQYHRLDIALDTFPYNGTTITCEALWMGVPVISLAGENHVSRVGLSLLSSAGLGEFVAHDPEDYVALAVRLAADPGRLDKIRQSLRQKMGQSPLMNAPALARNIEIAYTTMWEKWCAARG